MEFKARYEVIGLFSLAVIAGLFGFVYWLNNMGGFGERTVYRVRFPVPVSGLAVGGGVFFNGIRVGEVTHLGLVPQLPNMLEARIAISTETPMRADTKVSVSHQGLTGVADIMLSGGAPDALPLPLPKTGELPLLVADAADTRSWTESAARLLARVDDLIGRNSGRLESIFAGIERMTGTGGEKGAGAIHDLPAPGNFKALPKLPAYQLVVSEPSVPLALNTDKLPLRPREGELTPLEGSHFADNLPNLFQARLLQGFENAGYLSAVLRPADAADADYRLLIDIRAFHVDTIAAPKAVIETVAKLLDRQSKVVAAAPFRAEAMAASPDAGEAAAALGRAFSDLAKDIIDWSGRSLADLPLPEALPEPAPAPLPEPTADPAPQPQQP